MSFPPKQFGKFQIVSPLGRGGMGEVYKAWDSTIERFIALKFLTSPTRLLPDQARSRFVQEAKAAGRLRHPNIVTIYEFGELEGELFIAMEHIEGKTLEELIESKTPISWNEKLQWMILISDAVSYAHNHGIVHRDLKPANIKIDADGSPKILDFGIAKIQTSDLTQSGTVLGTPNYMSPEQIQGKNLDGRSDVFALGAILYELFTYTKAFPGDDLPVVLYRIISQHPPPLMENFTGPSLQLQRMIDRSLDKSPEKRLDAAEFREHLRSIAQTDSVMTIQQKVEQSDVATGSDIFDNLPAEKNILIGRERELDLMQQYLCQKELRFLTLTGPGGTGKTRLALASAKRGKPHFPGGVYFLALDSIADPSLVVPSICQMMGVRPISGNSLKESFQQQMQEKKSILLLVLDNFEHLLSSAAELADLVAPLSKIRTLITSRIRLNLYGEQEFAVTPLPLPDLRTVRIEELEKNPSVQLFLQRAQAIHQGFQLSSKNAPAVANICAQLDGLPLAIELAAARMKLLSPQEISVRLEKSLSVLAAGARDLPDRQKSLRGAISWSYQLLSSTERAVFEALSIFSGGFTLNGAEFVAGSLSSDFLETIASLVDHSLLVQKEQYGEIRFVMLKIIQEFANDKLHETSNHSYFSEKHAQFYLQFAREVFLKLSSPNPASVLQALDQENDNLRSAFRWFLAKKRMESAAELILSIWKFWNLRTYLREGRERVEELLENRASLSLKTATKLFYIGGVLAEAQGDYRAARDFFEQNLTLNRELQDDYGIASTINNLAIIAERQREYNVARKLFETSLSFWKQLDNQIAAALALNNLAHCAAMEEDYETAHSLYEESLQEWARLQDEKGRAVTLGYLGDLACLQKQYAQAFAFYQESLNIFEQLQDRKGIVNSLIQIGQLVTIEQEFEQASELLTEALNLAAEINDQQGVAHCLDAIAFLFSITGQYRKAVSAASHATKVLDLFGATRPIFEKERIEKILLDAQEKLGPESYQMAWNDGRSNGLNRILQALRRYEK